MPQTLDHWSGLLNNKHHGVWKLVENAKIQKIIWDIFGWFSNNVNIIMQTKDKTIFYDVIYVCDKTGNDLCHGGKQKGYILICQRNSNSSVGKAEVECSSGSKHCMMRWRCCVRLGIHRHTAAKQKFGHKTPKNWNLNTLNKLILTNLNSFSGSKIWEYFIL